jgi:Family of unknown function (DUF5895)
MAKVNQSAITIDSLISNLPDFTNDLYVDRTAIPRITGLRGEIDPKEFGLFVKADEAGVAGLDVPDGMEPIEYTYNDGEKAWGYLFQENFGLCVKPISPLLALTRKKNDAGQRPNAELYDAKTHKGDPEFVNATIYDVMLVNASGTAFLHSRPFRLCLKGAAGATFAREWGNVVRAVTKLYCEAKGRRYRPMVVEFNRLVIYYPTMARELAGSTAKSPALTFKPSVLPTTLLGSLVMTKDLYNSILESLPAVTEPIEPLLLSAAEDDGSEEY